jgi:hypothetical protein
MIEIDVDLVPFSSVTDEDLAQTAPGSAGV